MATPGNRVEPRMRHRNTTVRYMRFHDADWAKIEAEAELWGFTLTHYVALQLRASWDAGVKPKVLPPPVVNAWQGVTNRA